MTIFDVIENLSDDEIVFMFNKDEIEKETYYPFKIAGETYRLVVVDSSQGRFRSVEFMQVDGTWETMQLLKQAIRYPNASDAIFKMEQLMHNTNS